MEDLKQRITDLAALMDEFRLVEAELVIQDERIAFRRKSPTPQVVVSTSVPENASVASHEEHVFPVEPDPIPTAPKGTPITSPMTGIFYTAPSPNAPAFVKRGDSVTAGQVVGLIEAMKVFNEITASVSGIVLEVIAEPGQLVQPGDPLIYVG